MPELPERKVGIIACSGEELAVGTVTRLAALKVLHEMRPGKTVTICLPLFLAGGEGDRTFARFHPTITVDGCELRCAARGTEMYSGKPAASIVVSELAAEHNLGLIDGRRKLNDAGLKAVELTAEAHYVPGRRCAGAPFQAAGFDQCARGARAAKDCGLLLRLRRARAEGRNRRSSRGTAGIAAYLCKPAPTRLGSRYRWGRPSGRCGDLQLDT